MPHYTVNAGRIIEAPIARVWDLLADARNYSTWALMFVSKLEREGNDSVDGVGAIRNFGAGPMMSREEVVAFDPPTHLGYVLLSGLPIRNYRADVHLTPLGPDSCRIRWEGEFDASAVTGAVMAPFLRFVLGDFVRRLARVAPGTVRPRR